MLRRFDDDPVSQQRAAPVSGDQHIEFMSANLYKLKRHAAAQ